MVQNITTYQTRKISVIERINQNETIYICYDENDQIMFGTVSIHQAMKFCRINKCSYSTYPPKTYTED